MVFYNNLLTLGPIVILMMLFGEFYTIPHQAAWQSQGFYFALVSCQDPVFLGSVSVLWLSSMGSWQSDC